MGALWLYAIGIDEVREFFTADPSLAVRLRQVAAEAFPTPPPSPGLLDRLGPLVRRPSGPVLRPEVPHGSDVARLLGGEFVPPERLRASWGLLRAWLEASAWSSHRLDLEPVRWEQIDFELALAGVPASYSVRSLIARDLGIPLHVEPGGTAGYSRCAHVLAALAAWREVEHPSAELAGLLAWLEQFPQSCSAAGTQGRPAPDLVGVWLS